MMYTILYMLASLIVTEAIGFTVAPVTQYVVAGAEAVFRCQYPTADILWWRVNGSLVGRNPPPGITPGTTRNDDDSLVYTLSVTAQPEYNGTVVVCVARFDDGTTEEQTEPVLLFVNTGRFLLYPESVTTIAETMAIFQCQHTTADGISWRINGSNLTHFPQSVYTEMHHNNIFVLNVTALSKYNQTTIICVAFFADSQLSEETEPAIMMIQGSLDSVTELHRISSNIFWVPPPSLDLTGVDPDIVYCVEVYNITCGRRDLIISDCNVTEPNYTSNAIVPDGYIYKYIVTPRSNVEGARNGTNQSMKEIFPIFTVLNTELSIESSTSRTLQVLLTFQETDLPVPLFITVSLKTLDNLEDMTSAEATIDHASRLITIPDLYSKRLWSCTIFAYGCQEDPTVIEHELSTHNIQNVTASSPRPGQISVTGDYVDGSTANGIILIVYSLSNYSDVQYVAKQIEKNIQVTVTDLTDTMYRVSVFALEDGLPFPRVVTVPKIVTVATDNDQEKVERSNPVEYELHPNSTGICITCTFLDSSTTDCVAVVHQRISQLGSSGLMNIESSHMFNRSGDTAYGCIEGVNLEQYQVGVINGNILIIDPLVISDNTPLTVTVVAIVLISIIIVALVLTVVIVVIMKVLWKQILTNTLNDSKERHNMNTSDTHTNISWRQSQYEEAESFRDISESPEEKEITFVSSISSQDQDPNSQSIAIRSPITEKKLDLPVPRQEATISCGSTQEEVMHEKESTEKYSHNVEDAFKEAQSEWSNTTQESQWVVNSKLSKDTHQTKNPFTSADLDSTISSGDDHSKRKEKSHESGYGSHCNSEPNSYKNLLKENILKNDKEDLPLETIDEDEEMYAPIPFQGRAEIPIVDELTKTSDSA